MSVLDYGSRVPGPADPAKVLGRRGVWFSWAIFLAMSWTWCIGMFLPVLLGRDFGIWGWVVFAIPNVIGAASVGWMLSDGTSEAFVQVHRRAIEAFSLVTSCFQIFFGIWILTLLKSSEYLFVVVAGAAAIAMVARSDGQVRAFATLVLVASVVTGIVSASFGTLGLPNSMPDVPLRDLVALSAVCALGFLFCPYLDVSFHFARQRMSSGEARAAFSIGFGLFFLAMIVYSLLYARSFIRFIGTGRILNYALVPIVGHWVVQLGLTAGLHWSSAGMIENRNRRANAAKWSVITIVVAALAWFLSRQISYRGTYAGEIGYRLFLAFYGLIFPAYVWLCVIPGRGVVAPSRQRWWMLAIICAIASPFYWLGFIERKMVWVLPGVGIVLLAGLLVRRKR